MRKDWLQILVWAAGFGVIIFAVVVSTPLSVSLKIEATAVSVLLGGVFRYFFVPVMYSDALRELSDQAWKTGPEIHQAILWRIGLISKSNPRGLVGPIQSYLNRMEREHYVWSRPRHDPSGLTSSAPLIEYRLTPRGAERQISIVGCWVNRPTPPPQAA